MAENTLLVMDDQPLICDFVADVASQLGFKVHSCSDPDLFREAYEAHAPDVVVMDLQMPGVDGVELIRWLGAIKSPSRLLIMSGMDDKVLHTVRQLGGDYGLQMVGVLRKPARVSELQNLLIRCQSSEHRVTAEVLRQAIDSGHLEVYYQPVFHLAEGSGSRPALGSAEALVRLKPEGGALLMPERFIGLAERSGLIRPLTQRVIQRAVSDMAAWQSNGLSLPVAVNLSAGVLDDLELPNWLERMLADHDLPPARLILEVTEQAVSRDFSRMMDILSRLRIKGFPLAIDDFGTGHSSLVQLYHLPFTDIKIDRSFVLDLGREEQADTIVQAVINLAHSLKLRVCAEGVETQQVLDQLARYRCDKVQGYLFSRPIPGPVFLELARRWRRAGIVQSLAG